MKVAALIVHYMRDELTKDVLRQLADVDHVWVFDNGSPNRFDNPPGTLMFRVKNNLLYVGGVNFAMRYLAEDYDAVWVLNNDLSNLSRPMLDRLVEVLTQNSNVAAVTPAVVPNPHPTMQAGSEELRLCKFIDWPCPLVRMSAWFEVGSFDDKLKGYGCDLDFCHRAWLKNWKMAVVPRLAVKHTMGATMNQMVDAHGQNDLAFMATYLQKKWNVPQWEMLRD